MAPFYNAQVLGPLQGYDIDEAVTRYGVALPPSPVPDPGPIGPEGDEIVTIKIPRKYLVVDGYRLAKFIGGSGTAVG